MKEENINHKKDGLSPKGRWVLGNLLVKLFYAENIQISLNQWFGKEVKVVDNK